MALLAMCALLFLGWLSRDYWVISFPLTFLGLILLIGVCFGTVTFVLIPGLIMLAGIMLLAGLLWAFVTIAMALGFK